MNGGNGMCARLLAIATGLLILTSCFGSSAPERSYYVLHGVTISRLDSQPIAGLVRVRNLDAASIYEKFQIVVRKNPYELNYSEKNVWAVKPNRMVSDVIANALSTAQRFTDVIRELGERRPDYLISGDLGAIEIYDSGDLWYAHLALSLSLTRFSTGETMHTYSFDERKDVPKRTFSQATRALSELLSTAMDEFIADLDGLDAPRSIGTTRIRIPKDPTPPPEEPQEPGQEPIMIAEPPPGGAAAAEEAENEPQDADEAEAP